MLLRRRGASVVVVCSSPPQDATRLELGCQPNVPPCSVRRYPPDSALRAVRLTEPPASNGCWLLKTGRRLALRLITSEPLRSAAAALDISYETAGRTSKRCLKKPGPAARPSSSSSSSALQCFPPVLSEIKSGCIDGANLRGVGWARYGQRPAQHVTLVHPCSAIGACEHHCNIFGTIPAGGEDAARRRQRHGQDNPVGSNR